MNSPSNLAGLTQLGGHAPQPASPDQAVLERVANPHSGTLYLARFTAPEFTSLCPVTGQPDFAHLVIDPNSSAAEALYWVQNNGNTYTEVQYVGIPPIALTYYGTKFDTFEYSLGWSYDSRNRALFADRGSRHWRLRSSTLCFRT